MYLLDHIRRDLQKKGKKKCFILSYQSYRDEGKSEKEAKDEMVRRLQFGHNNDAKTIKEMLPNWTIVDNKKIRIVQDVFEKLVQEEIDDIHCK